MVVEVLLHHFCGSRQRYRYQYHTSLPAAPIAERWDHQVELVGKQCLPEHLRLAWVSFQNTVSVRLGITLSDEIKTILTTFCSSPPDGFGRSTWS